MDERETKEFRIVKCGDNYEIFAVEVFYNYDTSGRSEMDDKLLSYFLTEEEAKEYISELAEKYNLIKVVW